MSAVTIAIVVISGLFVLLAVLFLVIGPMVTNAGKRRRGPESGDWTDSRKRKKRR